jgi:hypothetical protein
MKTEQQIRQEYLIICKNLQEAGMWKLEKRLKEIKENSGVVLN